MLDNKKISAKEYRDIITKEISVKIKVLSFFALIGVLMIHTTYLESKQWFWLWFIQRSISTFSNFAVPFFFLISGFFFFIKTSDFKSILKNIKKRFRTLLIPYVFWCIFFFIVIYIFSLIYTPEYNYFFLIREKRYFDFLSYCFFTPAAFHLWYIRDLLIIVLISPYIYISLSYYPNLTLLLSYLLFGLCEIVPFISWGLWWFILGGYFAVLRRLPFAMIPSIYGPFMLFLGFFIAICSTFFQFVITPDKWYAIPSFLLIIIGLWKSYDYIGSKESYYWVCDYSFVIYCAHIPLLNIIKKFIFPICNNSYVGCLIGYIISPIICICIIVIMIRLLNKFIPHVCNIIFGGRI